MPLMIAIIPKLGMIFDVNAYPREIQKIIGNQVT